MVYDLYVEYMDILIKYYEEDANYDFNQVLKQHGMSLDEFRLQSWRWKKKQGVKYTEVNDSYVISKIILEKGREIKRLLENEKRNSK